MKGLFSQDMQDQVGAEKGYLEKKNYTEYLIYSGHTWPT
jgi:hypothetical protein